MWQSKMGRSRRESDIDALLEKLVGVVETELRELPVSFFVEIKGKEI